MSPAPVIGIAATSDIAAKSDKARMVTIGETYVERALKALVETAILADLRAHGPSTRDEIGRRVLAGNAFPGGVDAAFVEQCLARIERDEHVERDGDAYSATKDGLDDLGKIEGSFESLVRAGRTASSEDATTPAASDLGPPAGP